MRRNSQISATATKRFVIRLKAMIWGYCPLEGLPRAASSGAYARDRYPDSSAVNTLGGCVCVVQVVGCGHTTPNRVVTTSNVMQRCLVPTVALMIE